MENTVKMSIEIINKRMSLDVESNIVGTTRFAAAAAVQQESLKISRSEYQAFLQDVVGEGGSCPNRPIE